MSEFQVFVRFNRTVTIGGVKPTTTVLELKQKIEDKEGIPIKDQVLNFGSKPLKDEVAVQEYGIRHESTIMAGIRLLGGQPPKVNTTKCQNIGISITSDSCKACLLTYDGTCEGSEWKRIKMPTCKSDCYICTGCLLGYYNNAKNTSNEIRCPVSGTKCPNLMFDDIYVALDFSRDQKIKESEFWYDKVMKNHYRMAKCPTCSVYGYRDPNLKTSRIRCTYPNCKGGDFCFYCTKPWQGSNNDYCGHSDCPTSPETLTEALGNDVKQIGEITGIPSKRLCPKCKLVVIHQSGCKHMTCKKCKHQFCLSCLKVWPSCNCVECKENGVSNGCSNGINCTPAPIQGINS